MNRIEHIFVFVHADEMVFKINWNKLREFLSHKNTNNNNNK